MQAGVVTVPVLLLCEQYNFIFVDIGRVGPDVLVGGQHGPDNVILLCQLCQCCD